MEYIAGLHGIMAVKKYRSDICTVCKLILPLLWSSAVLHCTTACLYCSALCCTVHCIVLMSASLHSAQCSVATALQSVDVSPNLCHYLWALCLIRLRRLCWPPCYDTLQYPHVSNHSIPITNAITISLSSVGHPDTFPYSKTLLAGVLKPWDDTLPLLVHVYNIQ